jgi:RNA polymerase nonessential primary-like sigma factor
MIDSLSNATYLNHLNQHELMTAKEELELGRLVQKGCHKARTEFIQRNLKLVISLAGRYRGRGLDVADLVEEGNLGLMRAVDKYDPEMGYRFSTYAAWWIRQAVERALMNQVKTVRTPIHKQREFRQERNAIEAENETLPGYAKRNMDHWFNPSEQIVSLDQVVEGSDGSTGVDLLGSDAPSPEELAVSQEDHENVAAWLNLLPDLPRMVVIRRYGLDGRDSETLSAIGERLGTTRERIRQIQVEALRLLRRMVEAGRIPADAAIFD